MLNEINGSVFHTAYEHITHSVFRCEFYANFISNVCHNSKQVPREVVMTT
jgi:hypothetical protein